MSQVSAGDKAKMTAARTLIEEKRYGEARSLLVGVKHPQATNWIMKIDAITAQSVSKPKSGARYFWGALSITSFVIGIGGLLILFAASSYDQRVSSGVVAFIGLIVAYFARRMAR